MIELALPYPPSVNRYWRNVNGRTLISKAGRLYREAVSLNARSARAGTLTGRLSVTVELTMPDKRRRDLDNTLKALLDAMESARVYLDDSQIDRLEVIRGPVEAPGMAKVRIHEQPDAASIAEWARNTCS